MMENESLRGSRNTTAIFLTVLLAGAVIWAIVATVMASKNADKCVVLAQEKEQIRTEAEQTRAESERRMMEADKLRKTALEWTRQHQLQIQADMKKKADEAAAAAKAAADKAKAKPQAKDAKDAKGKDAKATGAKAKHAGKVTTSKTAVKRTVE